jgi:outer membrane protein OmpA-like peptidoglycan-associated protein
MFIQTKDDKINYSFINENVSNFVEFRDNEFGISVQNMVYDQSGNAIIKVDENQSITALHSQGSSMWIGTNKSLYRYNMVSSKLEELTKRNSSFDKATVNFIHRDDGNNLWIGSSDGDYRITKDKWKKYNAGKNVIDYFENNEGMWFVSEDDMWLVDLKNRYYPVGLGKDLTKGILNDFTIDNKGKLYFASDKLTAYDPYSNKIKDYEDEVAFLTNKSTALLSSANSLLIGTDGYGLYELTFLQNNPPISVNVLVKSSPSCVDKSDGTAEAFVKGGTPPYSYKWLGYEQNNSIITNLKEGELTIEITDAENQRTAKTLQVKALPSPEVEVLSIIKPDKNLGNGSITLKLQEKHTYLWSNGQRNPVATNLFAGKFSVTITDSKNCTTTQLIELEEKEIDSTTVEKSEIKTQSPQNTGLPSTIDTNLLVKGRSVILDRVKFLADSLNVTPESLPTLNELYEILQSNSRLKIEIGGHTNTIPPHDYCDQLSTARAKNIAEYFYLRGISQSRITYKGYGKRRPLTSSTTEEGRQLNQRVEISILEN